MTACRLCARDRRDRGKRSLCIVYTGGVWGRLILSKGLYRERFERLMPDGKSSSAASTGELYTYIQYSFTTMMALGLFNDAVKSWCKFGWFQGGT